MNELLKIEVNENNKPTVSGRELHDFLEVKTPYQIWFPRMIEYGFVENVDFISFEQKCTKPQGGRPSIDHQLTIDMAKHLAMIQRNEKGMIARNYFIDVEKKWNSPEMVMSRALAIANKNLLMKDEQILKLTSENAVMKPKAEYFDELVDRKTLTGIRETAKLFKINQNKFVKWLLDNKFMYRDIKNKLQAYSQYTVNSTGKGYFEPKERHGNTSPWSGTQVFITPKGREAFRLLLQIK